jgi:hypothetical protein
MKNKLTIMAGAVAVLISFSPLVQAVPIVGSIGFTGTYTQVGGTSGNLGTATDMTINTVAISGPATTGVLVGASLTSFSSPIYVNGNSPTLVGAQLWSVLVGAITYTFTVGSESQTLGAGNTTLTLAGAGTLGDGTVADNTSGTWTLGFGVSGAAFTWNATTANNVPDGGMTVMLLGAALYGLFMFRKKVMA